MRIASKLNFLTVRQTHVVVTAIVLLLLVGSPALIANRLAHSSTAATELQDHDHAKSPATQTKSGGDEHGHDHGGHTDEVKLTTDAVRQSGIRINTAKRVKLESMINAPARVAYNAEALAHVGSVVTGRVSELKARMGDAVKKGDVLVVVDSPELGEAQSEYIQRHTAAETAKPGVELAKSAYDRAQKLYDQSQGISLNDVQTRLREYQTAQAALRTAETAATASSNRLRLLGMSEEAVRKLTTDGEIDPKYTIRAPIDGRVIEREATLGELVGPEKERLLVIADLNTVWVLADVPEAKLSELAVGAKAQLSTSSGAPPIEGTVSYISPELHSATRTVRVRVEVPNPEMRLRPGMFARAEITGGAAGGEPVLVVPEGAVQTVEGEPSVFVPVEGEPNTFAKRAVGVGAPINGMVPVFAGLKDGEKYVATGSFILKAELGKAGAAHEH